MPLHKERGAEPLPGYRLLEPLGRGGCGEVWKCEAPGGLLKAIKFVPGSPLDRTAPPPLEEELRALTHIKDIRHPFLLSLERVEIVAGELVLVMELAEGNLLERAQHYRQAGRPGIPRTELLHYLSEAAEVLDLLQTQYGLQHLDIKPHNLFLVGGHIKVGDFGLVRRLAAGDSSQIGAVTPLYAAPEVFLGQPSPQSDQYSLAIVYQELLTGQLPFSGACARQLLLAHTQGEPDLHPLPEADRPIVARALAKEPAARYPTCQAFIQALRESGGFMSSSEDSPRRTSEPPAAVAPPTGTESAPTTPLPTLPPHFAETPRCLRQTPAPPAPPRRPAVHACRLLAGYRLEEHLASTPLVETWRALAPTGQICLLKILYGVIPDGQQREEAVLRFQLLQHPTLLPAEILLNEPGRIVLVMDWAPEGLRQRWRTCQAQGLAGIPAAELWNYLETVAEALDYLYQQHSLQHGLLQPRVFRFAQGRLALADFGLAQLFWLPARQPLAQYHSRYAPPELFAGRLSSNSDQFSLALLYCELRTGQHPFRGQTENRGQPLLEGLPPEERPALVRALHPDPEQRWPGCRAFVQALTAEMPAARDGFHQRLQENVRRESASLPTDPSLEQTPLSSALQQLLRQVGGSETQQKPATQVNLLWGEGYLQGQFSVFLPLGIVHRRLNAFRQQCHGELLREEDSRYFFYISLPARLWQQWLGWQPGLEIQVYLHREHPLAITPVRVRVLLHPRHCSRRQAEGLLRNLGLSLLDGLQRTLTCQDNQRTQDRLLWPWPVRIRPLHADGTAGEAILCRGKDISASGIGFYLPHELPVADILVELPPTPYTPALVLPAVLVRARRCGDGWYEAGALFCGQAEPSREI